MNMQKSKSFWSSIPGFVTGLAGLLTGVVGLVTVLIQLDVIGGDSDDSPNTTEQPAVTTESTSRSARSGGGASQSGQSGQSPQFAVAPTAVRLDTLLNKQADVVVTNTGSSTLAVDDVSVSGPAAAEFTVDEQDCTADELGPNNSCSMKVTYRASARGEHSATLNVEVAGASVKQVSLTGSRPL